MNSSKVLRKLSRSTMQACITRLASGSSMSDKSRCSSVANSCRRALAKAKAPWMDCSRVS